MKLDFILHTITKSKEIHKGYEPNTITFNPIDWHDVKKQLMAKNKYIPTGFIYGLKIVVDKRQKAGRFLMQEL